MPLVISTDDVVKVYVDPPSPVRVSLVTSMSLVAPPNFKNPVPVTANTPVDASNVAEVIAGDETLLTVIPLPVRSALPRFAAIQSAAAARL